MGRKKNKGGNHATSGGGPSPGHLRVIADVASNFSGAAILPGTKKRMSKKEKRKAKATARSHPSSQGAHVAQAAMVLDPAYGECVGAIIYIVLCYCCGEGMLLHMNRSYFNKFNLPLFIPIYYIPASGNDSSDLNSDDEAAIKDYLAVRLRDLFTTTIYTIFPGLI